MEEKERGTVVASIERRKDDCERIQKRERERGRGKIDKSI